MGLSYRNGTAPLTFCPSHLPKYNVRHLLCRVPALEAKGGK